LVINAGYPQYISISVNNISQRKLYIKDASLYWGKWYFNDNKDKEFKNGPNGQTIAIGANGIIAQSCGRKWASSGTTGELNIYDSLTNQKVTNFFWDCPYGNSFNRFGKAETNTAWGVKVDGGYIESGAIGEVTLTISHR